jgi:hypothetical protein
MSENTRAEPQGSRRRELVNFRTSRAVGQAFGVVAEPGWWSQTGSNRRPPACKAGALPTELWPLRESESQDQESGKLSPDAWRLTC